MSKESVEHYFLAELIADEVRHYTEKVYTKQSYEADVIFEMQVDKLNLKYAFEIETGTLMTRPMQLQEKIEKNDQKYFQWWFVVTNKDNKKKYSKLHDTLTRTEVKHKIKELF